ncbi:peptidoglycan bridge formation glycyltransferase FemA/FemB family protein [bacterium]|nr:peptidoglycan bridge formation glycyltransferase FemA/FemB family protein [bacterium]
MDNASSIFSLNTAIDPERWNAFVMHSPHGHFMQLSFWGEYKSAFGWKPVRFGLEQEGRLVAGAQVLMRRPALSPWAFAYCPRGPLLDPEEEDMARLLYSGIHAFCRSNRVVFLRMEPEYPNQRDIRDRLIAMGFRRTGDTNQPRCTLLVDLNSDKESLFKSLDRNARRLIHRADENGVTVSEGGEKDLPDFYRMMKQTGRQKHIPVHSESFFSEAYRLFHPAGICRLYMARKGDDPVAGVMVFLYRGRGAHLWAGFSERGRELCAGYKLHWSAILAEKELGGTCCDLWGIPDEIADMTERGEPVSSSRSDGMWGIYRFKKGFGGQIACYAGTFDYVYKPAAYSFLQGFVRKRHEALSAFLDRMREKRRRH